MTGPASRRLRPSGFFAFRACKLPMRVLASWADGVEAPSAPSEGLAGALDRDRARLRAVLDELVGRPEVRTALYVASPDLVDALQSRAADPGVEAALVRYVTRMASRPTPFGLFAACGTGSMADRTRVELPDPATWGRFTQLDADFLDALVRHRAVALRDRLVVTPNDSLHLMAGRWRYVESRLDGLERNHHLVEVAGSKHLERAVHAATGGATRAEVAHAVAAGGVDAHRAEAFVDRLIEAQVLVPELEVTVTGPPPLDALIADLDALGDEVTVAVLRSVRDDLAALDAEGPAAPPQRHDAVAARLGALPAPIDRARLLHVDATVPPCAATLARSVVDEMARGVEILRRIGPRPGPSDLDRFVEAFEERYEAQEVPLLEALDEELGVGFGGDARQRDPAPLLDGLELPGRATRDVRLGKRERHLLDLLHRAWTSGAYEVVLGKDDIAALETDGGSPLPTALAAMAVLARTSAGDRIVLAGANGPPGARMLGRFCHADAELERHVRAHLREEEALDPDALHAEIVHLPSGRMVNILARPHLRDFEVTWLGRSRLPSERVLPAGDLLVSVRDGRVVLRSRTLGRRVVPRLTSAHNYDRHSPGVYRFLASVASEGVAQVVGWTWFPFEQAPFTPRVRFGSLVLARAAWSVHGDELRRLDRRDPVSRWQAVQSLRARRTLPRWICLVDGDNVLAFDLDNVLSVDTLVRAVRGRTSALLEELFPGPDELVASSPDGGHALEVVVPFVADAPVRVGDRPAVEPAPLHARRTFPPGSEWSYLKLYAGTATLDRLLLEAVAPLAAQLVGSGAADSWFFVRYADPGLHLRARFHGDPDAIGPALAALAARVLEDGLASDAVLGTYRREVERYGGPDGIVVAERLFHADSQAVVELLELFEPGVRGLNARWRLGVLGAELLLQDLGLDAPARSELVRRRRDDFALEFRADARLRKGIAARVRTELASIDELVAAAADGDHPLAPGIAVLARRSSAVAPLAADLAALRVSGRLHRPVEELAASFVHMWLNRLCRSESRFHEYVTYALLARLHEVRAARAQSSR